MASGSYEKLNGLICDLVNDSTFKLEAVERIKSIKDLCEQQKKENEILRESMNDAVKQGNFKAAELDKLNNKIVDLNKQIEALNKEVSVHKSIERDAQDSIIYGRCASEAKRDIFQLVSMIFKAPMMKEVMIRETDKHLLDPHGNVRHVTDRETTETKTVERVNGVSGMQDGEYVTTAHVTQGFGYKKDTEVG